MTAKEEKDSHPPNAKQVPTIQPDRLECDARADEAAVVVQAWNNGQERLGQASEEDVRERGVEESPCLDVAVVTAETAAAAGRER